MRTYELRPKDNYGPAATGGVVRVALLAGESILHSSKATLQGCIGKGVDRYHKIEGAV